MRRRHVLVPAAILAVALAARVAVTLMWDGFEPLTDGLEFDRLATSLANGDGWGRAPFPAGTGGTAFRAPGYPSLLAGLYVVVGDHSWRAARLLNALLGTGVVGLIGILGRQLFSRRVALVAMGIAAVHPLLVVVASPIGLEPLLGVLVLGTVAVTLRHLESPGQLRWPILVGVLLGVSILVRELGALAAPPLAWLAWRASTDALPAERRSASRGLVAPAVMLVVAGVVVLPWTIRNAVVLDAFVPVSTSAGVGLAGTYNETSLANEETPAQWIPPWQDPSMAAIILSDPEWTEPALSSALTDEALDVMRSDPTSPLKAGFWNTVRMFDLDGGTYTRFISQFVPYPERLLQPAIVGGWLVLALAAGGAVTRLARRAPLAVWAIPVLMVAFMVIVLPGSVRYRATVEPFAVLLAAAAVVTVAERLQARWRPVDEGED